MNLGDITYYASQIAFVDAFKAASPWITAKVDFSAPLDTKIPVKLRPDDWPASLEPNQAAMALMFRDSEGRYPAGEYVLLYDGDGTIVLRDDAKVISRSAGRITANVATPTKAGIRLDITRTNPADPIRNIRFILPGFERTYESAPFHPQFLERLSPFAVIRFMKWQRIDDPEQSQLEWSDRATPSSASQATPRRGVALEYVARLANELRADPWVHVPHEASDDYVRRMATLLRDALAPDRRVYLEYSNEIWNAVQPAIRTYTQARGLALGLSTTGPEAALRFQAQRSVEVFRIFEDVFGSTKRLIRVLASQHASTGRTTTVLDWQEAYKHADALAVAPYFGYQLGLPANASKTTQLTVDQMVDEAERLLAANRPITDAQVALAKARGLELIGYEGGQHLAAVAEAVHNPALVALLAAANRHPRMKDLYVKDLAGWRDAGGRLFVAFNFIEHHKKSGSWGVIEWHDQDLATAPKYQGLREFIAKNPRWW